MSLDQKTAIRRSSLIRLESIQYNYHINLQPQRYQGLAEITFYLQNINFQQDLELDFSGEEVETVIINNLEVEVKHEDNFIYLPRSCLQKGKNRVSVLYDNEYNIDFSGLISFTDNGEQFLFTDFEPYYANRVFPCFDQPNLKAKMILTVIAPSKWKVLSHERPPPAEQFTQEKYLQKAEWNHEKSRHLLSKFSQKVVEDTSITIFPKTQLLPTYIFCFAAGNYSQIPTDAGEVPMSLFCPPSVLDKLNIYKDFIFDVTIRCMDFYKKTFNNLAYPFKKYDQLFIREFAALAMENAGIVTFDEANLLPKQNATDYDYYLLGLVVAHELSHHWFGNYVTMVWWDDLWLNESFAEWISCYSIEMLKDKFVHPFESSYFFFRDTKAFGYKQDERNSATHPIRGTVRNTDEASSIFDGITYEKGAAALKQLAFLVGQTNFFTAVSNYFTRFAWGNATIDDLLEDIRGVFPGPGTLDDWKKTWLEQPSLNVFSIDWDSDNSKITLHQKSFNDKNILRMHKMKISFFNDDGTFAVQQVYLPAIQSLDVTYIDKCRAVLVNHQDYTFAENIIDPVSLAFFKANIDKIIDPLNRIIIWYNIRSMVNLSYVPILDYIALIEDKLFSEPSNFILEKILENLYSCLEEFIAADVGYALRSKIFQRIYKELQIVADAQTEKIQILQLNYVDYARTNDQIIQLESWLNANDPKLAKRLPNFDQNWKIVRKIFTLPREAFSKWNTFLQIQNKDKDLSRVEQEQTICKVLLSTQAQFQTIYNEFISGDVSLTIKELKLKGWRNQYHYDWIVNKYQERYFEDIVELSQKLTFQQFEFFYDNLRPIDNNWSYQIEKYNEVLTELDGMEEHSRNIRKIVDDLTLRIKNTAYNVDINTALTQKRAILRFDYIEAGSITYTIHIAFARDSDYYTGMAEISFKLTSVPIFLPLDCVCDTIYALNVNGTKLYPNTNAEFLLIHQDNLRLGNNFISIYYRNKYNNDGLGCMSYLQTVSVPNSQYLYTKFEPYGAHRFMPCFDQPDLKARANFNVIIPYGWMSASNQADSYNGAFSVDDYKLKTSTQDPILLDIYLASQSQTGYFYAFKPTQILSTYLYCVVAGQYQSVTATPAQQYKNIPMSVFSIKSYKPALDRLAPFIFEMTTLSLQVYETNFKKPYPFNKYDSVFCHEFKSGAMENAGIITFNDTYLYPEEVSLEKMLQFASTIVHQNSHNWFGNYVTMKWWDDLWLNESFADFIAHWCLENIKDKVTTIAKYDSGWKIFLVRGVAGYREDQITETTHAVRSEVQNTSIASTYFDRITYQKGSATLKQLMNLMTEANFFLGVQEYFRDFGWKNGTIDDFLGKMSKQFTIPDFTLDDWKKSWLLTPSLNVVSVQWDSQDLSEIAQLTIHQNAYTEVYPSLRYHKTQVAFFNADATYDVQDVLLTPNATTILEYNGSKNYKAILVNSGYWGYFKYIIDPVSLLFFQENLNKIQDVLTRMIIWHDINEQVRDYNYKLNDFIDLFLRYIYLQTDDKIFEFECSFVKDAVNNYIPIASRDTVKQRIFDATYAALKTAQTDNRTKLLKDQLTVFVTTQTQIQTLEDWRNNINLDLKAFPITVLQAWEVVKLVYSSAVYTPQIKWQTFKDQQNKSPGIKAQLTLNTCNTIIAPTADLATIYNSFKEMVLSLDAKASFSQGWNNFTHLDDLLNIYKAKYFNDLPDLSRKLISNHFEFFYQNLKPIDDQLQETINSYKQIKLEGDEMIGHMKVLTQIRYMYQLRQLLYAFNA